MAQKRAASQERAGFAKRQGDASSWGKTQYGSQGEGIKRQLESLAAKAAQNLGFP